MQVIFWLDGSEMQSICLRLESNNFHSIQLMKLFKHDFLFFIIESIGRRHQKVDFPVYQKQN